ncbi:hypothetical protein PQX77_013695, partial [Marasmius sp. AFHP31]
VFRMQFTLGKTTISPRKRRSKANKTVIPLPAPSLRLKLVNSKLALLLQITRDSTANPVETLPSSSAEPEDGASLPDNASNSVAPPTNEETDLAELPGHYDANDFDTLQASHTAAPPSRTANSQRDTASATRIAGSEAADSWKRLLPMLMDPLLRYQNETAGKIGPFPPPRTCATG